MTDGCSLTVISVDPGRMKCGVAVVRFLGARDPQAVMDVLYKQVVSEFRLEAILAELAERYSPDVIVIGNGTHSRQCADRLRLLDLAPVETIDETGSTLAARRLYLRYHLPPWFLRWIPCTLICPRFPLDDYAALVLAERYWEYYVNA